MKILYYSTAYYAEHGGSNHSRAFVEWARKNSDVEEVIVFPPHGQAKKSITGSSGGTLSTFLKKHGITTVLRFLRRSRFYQEEILRTIEEQKPDAVIMRLDGNFPQIAKIKQRFPHILVATEVNASPFDESFKNISFRLFFQRQERAHLTKADVNFFVSNTLRENIMLGQSNDQRDVVLANGVDTDMFAPSTDKRASKISVGLPSDKTVIGYIGTLDLSKRMGVLVNALASIRKKRADVYFVIVGDGPDMISLRTLQKEQNLEDVLLLTGNVSHDIVPKYLQAFDIAVHHAAREYMCPLKLFEYLATGLPVIGPDTPAVREIFTDEEHLFLCQAEATSIQRKLEECLANMPHANALATEGLMLVKRKYTWKINADTVISKLKARTLK